jgi:hypothetical protein
MSPAENQERQVRDEAVDVQRGRYDLFLSASTLDFCASRGVARGCSSVSKVLNPFT